MGEYRILPTIKSPSDVKRLSEDDIKLLCTEIREKLVEVVSVNGGHLSPNLGVVELTVALHRSFNMPKDSIVWDVGHQSYTHKLLTGRYKDFDTLRLKDGISGFPKREESRYDDFNTGHSSTSISAAFGIANAKLLSGDNSNTIAVIGDGSFTGGLAFEGMNNAGRFSKNFIVVLNDQKRRSDSPLSHDRSYSAVVYQGKARYRKASFKDTAYRAPDKRIIKTK